MSKHILLLVNNTILKDESFRDVFVNGEGLSANKIFARTHQNLTDERSSQHRWRVARYDAIFGDTPTYCSCCLVQLGMAQLFAVHHRDFDRFMFVSVCGLYSCCHGAIFQRKRIQLSTDWQVAVPLYALTTIMRPTKLIVLFSFGFFVG